MTGAALHEALDAIARLDPELHAFAALDLARAQREVAAFERGDRLGPLAGVLVGVKDAYTTLDPATRYGTSVAVPAMQGAGEAVVVRRLRDAGAILPGKTNMTELCIGDYAIAGTPRSPTIPGRSVGASSGGCAVAVAAGLVAASVGTDTGGSVRAPAAYCGVVGFKPTFGTIPLANVVPLAPSLDHGGVMARDVATAALVASVAAARDLLDGPAAPRLVVVDPAEIASPAIADALAAIAAALRRSAAPVEVMSAAGLFDGWREAFMATMPAEASRVHGALADDPRLGIGAREILREGLATSDAELRDAAMVRAQLAERPRARDSRQQGLPALS
ncbi:MAG: amidase, partial [Solirubrobacteraceae bacterium]|nr:amidase [Solirubrobacteraceae bacterium]